MKTFLKSVFAFLPVLVLTGTLYAMAESCPKDCVITCENCGSIEVNHTHTDDNGFLFLQGLQTSKYYSQSK